MNYKYLQSKILDKYIIIGIIIFVILLASLLNVFLVDHGVKIITSGIDSSTINVGDSSNIVISMKNFDYETKRNIKLMTSFENPDNEKFIQIVDGSYEIVTFQFGQGITKTIQITAIEPNNEIPIKINVGLYHNGVELDHKDFSVSILKKN